MKLVGKEKVDAIGEAVAAKSKSQLLPVVLS